ncbi:hypothetical protein ABW21_db0206780 [Orbilia brochopaga]|nr:hypothetical protein ABW21_db0206780 [Drechslerella brochopaga]
MAFERFRGDRTINLEDNQSLVYGAVEHYIDVTWDELSARTFKRSLDQEQFAKEQLRSNADGTFLWVHLVMKELSSRTKLRKKLLPDFSVLPTGLPAIYQRMLSDISNLEEPVLVRLCFQALSAVILAHRPLRVDELPTLLELPDDEVDPENYTEYVAQLVEWCGSFLLIRESMVHIVHQSAKDFLTSKQALSIIFGGCGPYSRQLGLKVLCLPEKVSETGYLCTRP